jgi:AraC-like DNA-binding protein
MNLKTYFINRNVSYREVLADSDIFEKFYQIDNPKAEAFIAIPDGCVDIQYLWRGSEMKVHIAGSFREGGIAQAANYDRCFGGRFKTGVLPNFLRGHIEELIGSRRAIDTYLRIPELEEEMNFNLLLEQKADRLLWLIGNEKTNEDNATIRYIIEQIEESYGNIVVGDMVESLGYSHRYTDKVFKNTVGFSIKKFANIVRLQECIKCLFNRDEDAVYNKLGYYDQSHFIHDFKRFTSYTPSAFKKKIGHIDIV